MRLAQLGQRASLLLGLLLGSPLTTLELYDRVVAGRALLDRDELEATVTDLQGFLGGSIFVTIEGILSGGTMEVLHQLERLESEGYVGRLGEPDYNGCLWWALPAAAWHPTS